MSECVLFTCVTETEQVSVHALVCVCVCVCAFVCVRACVRVFGIQNTPKLYRVCINQ